MSRSPQAEAPAHPVELSRARMFGLIAVVGLGVSAGPLDSAVNVAFPATIAAFGVGVDAVQWIVVSYVLTYSCLLLGCGRIADIIGHKRVFVIGMLWSIAALCLCASARAFEWFLLGRIAQGIGTAALLSCGPALMTLSFPASERTRALAWYALLFSSASAAGPLLGGLFVEAYGWSSVFWFRVPILGIALLGAWFVLPSNVTANTAQTFDWLGALALIATLFAAMAALNSFGRFGFVHAWPWLLLGVSILCGYAFIRRALAIAHPIIDLRLFRDRLFASANLAHVLVNAASFMVMLLVPFYLARVFANEALLIGGFLALYPLGAVLASGVARLGLERFGAVVVSHFGLALAASGLFLASAWPAEAVIWHIVLALGLHGFGYGLFQVAVVDVVMATVPRSAQGVGGSLNMLTRTLGVVAGASLGSSLFTSLGGSAQASSSNFLGAHATVFAVAGIVVITASALLMWTVPRERPS